MSNVTDLRMDLPPEIRDQHERILDGEIDEFEALEEIQDKKEAETAERET